MGFKVKIVHVTYKELNALKAKNGIPRRLWACHTGFIGNYVIEGHVPGEMVLRLLKEKPEVAGIGVPGMPAGSPGMGGTPKPFDVFTFDKNGQLKLFAHVKP